MSFFRRAGRLPQLRTGSSRRIPHGISLGRQSNKRLGIYAYRRRTRINPLSLALFGVAAVCVVIVASPLWLPGLRWVIPDRYLLTYAPGPLQKWIFRIDPSRVVPTPVGFDEQAALALLGSTATPISSSSPGPGALSGSADQYVQPTAFAYAATPTMTPVYAQAAGDKRAQDRENAADLSHASRLLTGFKWIRQGANDCGPASITVLMSYWGIDFTQEKAVDFLKPNPEDPNVRADEISAFVETTGYQATVRINGNIDLIKQFILAGYPVMIETGYDPEPQVVGWTSHYLTIVGFSDEDREFIAMDTYRRPNWGYPYDEIDKYWRQFNRRYLIVHRPDQTAAVASLIGANMDDTVMYTNAMRTAQLELSVDRNDPFGWHNLGASLTGLQRYEDAASAFDQARQVGLPHRFLWYQFDMFEAYLKVGGKYVEQTLALADDVLDGKATEEAFYYKGLAYLEKGDKDSARQQFQLAVRFNKHYDAARAALDALGESD